MGQWLRVLGFLWVVGIHGTQAADHRPLGHVQDAAATLSLPLTRALEKVLTQHESISDETVFVVIAATEPEDPGQRASELFEAWKPDTTDPMKAVLIYFDSGRNRVEVRAGLGMTEFLEAFPLESVTQRVFGVESRHGSVSRAVILSTLEVLKALEDPNLEEARRILREGGFQGAWQPITRRSSEFFWPLFFFFGALGLLYVLFIALSGEAHYSSEGWIRVRHFMPPGVKRWIAGLRRPKGHRELITGGGVSGSY